MITSSFFKLRLQMPTQNWKPSTLNLPENTMKGSIICKSIASSPVYNTENSIRNHQTITYIKKLKGTATIEMIPSENFQILCMNPQLSIPATIQENKSAITKIRSINDNYYRETK